MRFASFVLVMFLSPVCVGYLSVDFNRDGIVDFNDFAALANQRLEQDMDIGQEFGGFFGFEAKTPFDEGLKAAVE